MPVSYARLWKLLVDKRMSKTDLKDASGISTNVLAKLGKDELVSMDSMEKICRTLSCDIGDVMEVLIPTDTVGSNEPKEQICVYDERYKKISEVDWSFINSRQDSISLLHPYPARFIDALPRQLISIIGCPDDTAIFDPFCGSGTTLIEAQRAGIQSVGVDLTPIACLISRVKTTPLDDSFLEVARRVHDAAYELFTTDYVTIPGIPNLDHWFKESIQKALSALMQVISSEKSETNKDALSFALSSIIVRVSNQESDTRYAAIEKRITGEDVFSSFQSACKKLAFAKQETSFLVPAKVIENNILTLDASRIGQPVGLVITSPPYPNAYEYWLYHKYRMWWLGYDPISVRSFEIGARPHYQKKNGQTEKDFAAQMEGVFKLFDSCVIQGGHVCIVIGRSIIRGREIDNAALITEIAINHNYSLVAKIPRDIASTRKSFNLSYGKITTEYILVLRRD
mgnify:FL=1